MRSRGIRSAVLWGSTVVVCSAFALAQDFTRKPKSPTPSELPGQQLIVWTETQKPQPVPGNSTEMRATSDPNASQIQVLTGTIVARGADLLLAAEDRTDYRIANQPLIRSFAGREVRIRGSLDQSARMLHVLTIEALK